MTKKRLAIYVDLETHAVTSELQEVPFGNVAEILAKIMMSGNGRLKIAPLFEAYAKACEIGGKQPVPEAEFAQAVRDYCKKDGIQIEATDNDVFLRNARLKKSISEAA